MIQSCALRLRWRSLEPEDCLFSVVPSSPISSSLKEEEDKRILVDPRSILVREQKEKAAPIAVVGEEAGGGARPSIEDLLPHVGSERDNSFKSGYGCRTGKGKEIWGCILGQV
ncbi:hypothetical protein AAC387_Pa05g0240 [Persea americana]